MIHFGTAWYPEHWPRERWQRDCELMREAGMTVVRLGEFAWSTMEPEPGRFELDWLAEAVDLAAAHGLQSVLCTPSATPPAWLVRRYPAILAQPKPGSDERRLHGMRCHYDPANEDFRRHCRSIVGALAERFATHPQVIGWQTDNEFQSICCNPASLAAFRRWLRQRYGSLEALNQTWSTRFWSQEYFAWEDIQPPLEYPNPGLMLDWHRFHSHLLADFQAEQIRLLRQHLPDDRWITHNFHPFDEIDRCVVGKDLDLISWDAYVTGDQLSLDVAANALDCATIRGIKQRNFWVMETLPGFVNWRAINRHFEPGETRAMAWHLIGHGADAVLYWQWRSAPCNQEQYHGCLLHQDGEPRPVYHEIAGIGAELKRVDALLTDSKPHSDVTIVNRWCDRQAIRRQPHHQDYEPRDRAADVYRAWQRAGFAPVGLAAIEADPDRSTRLIVAPHLHLLSQAEAELLERWVRAGGHLVLGPRSGMKDEHNRLHQRRQPGPLADLLGAEVEEFFALGKALPLIWDDEPVGEATMFAEWLRVTEGDCQVLARYGPGQGWLAGQAAVVSRAVDQGRISYFGCCGDAAVHRRLVQELIACTGLTIPLAPPSHPDIEITCRQRPDGQRLLILVNHGGDRRRQELPGRYRDHLSRTELDGTIELAAYGVAVLTVC